MSKGLGYTVPEPIRVSIRHIKEVKTSLKGTPMLGFIGTFSVNFEIPDYWGIGKSVSRGFGTVRRVNLDKK
ncbi:MAG: CRISPR-associated endonuclease Cas6 [Candidatus Omnitrophica bacterium]|nr:CRISPR-associated endonuclease Cas6 [Candidatus Omnitrophota bacterium]